MSRLHWQNVAVLSLGISIAAVGAFYTEQGRILRHGAAIAIAVFFVIKGASKLKCQLSDVLVAAVALCALILSKTIPASKVSPLLFEACVLALIPFYIFTGLTYREIILSQRSRRAEPGERP